MGVIKDGYSTGVLPTGKVFAVNYPGYPLSMEHAVTTLDGSESIAEARRSLSKTLKLQFRPEDPYSHPVYGEHLPCNHFLLKISKHNNSKGVQTAERSQKDDTSISGPEDKIYAEIAGHVSEAYYFNGMVDYQHVLAVHADVAWKKKRNWADLELQFEKHDLIDADQEDLMMLPPPLILLRILRRMWWKMLYLFPIRTRVMSKNLKKSRSFDQLYPFYVCRLEPSMYIRLIKKREGLVQHHLGDGH